jgi:hypothetical protein
MILETWKPVVGYENYEVSDIGRVRRTDGKFMSTFIRERHTLNRPRYRAAALSKHGKQHVLFVHGLVCAAFHGDSTGMVVRHLDGDSLNNCSDNLAWGTQSENTQDRVKHGTMSINVGSDNPTSKLTPEFVKAIRADVRKDSEIAKDYGVGKRTINGIKRRETWKHVT